MWRGEGGGIRVQYVGNLAQKTPSGHFFQLGYEQGIPFRRGSGCGKQN